MALIDKNSWNLTDWFPPIHEKYMNKYIGHWFIFGKSADGRFVDIADADGDKFLHVPIQLASKIITARDEFLEKVHTIMNTECDDWQKKING